MFKKILVGTDGFGPASRAVERAVDLARSSGAEVIVLHVYAPPGPSTPLRSQDAPAGVEVAKGLLHDVERRHGGGDVKLRTVSIEGEPSESLIETAQQEAVDLIVIGNKGMSELLNLGSVPNRVSHHAPCHVLIVATEER